MNRPLIAMHACVFILEADCIWITDDGGRMHWFDAVARLCCTGGFNWLNPPIPPAETEANYWRQHAEAAINKPAPSAAAQQEG